MPQGRICPLCGLEGVSYWTLRQGQLNCGLEGVVSSAVAGVVGDGWRGTSLPLSTVCSVRYCFDCKVVRLLVLQ